MHYHLGEPRDRAPSLTTSGVRELKCRPVQEWERALEMVCCRCHLSQHVRRTALEETSARQAASSNRPCGRSQPTRVSASRASLCAEAGLRCTERVSMGVWSDGLGERNRISSNLPGEGGGNSSRLPAQTAPSPLIALALQGEHRSCCTGRGSFHKCGDALTVMSLVTNQTSTSLPCKA